MSFRSDQFRKLNEIRAWTGRTISSFFREWIDAKHAELSAKQQQKKTKTK